MADEPPDNVRKLPITRVDRVARLASAISKVMEVSECDSAEEHLTALMLVQSAIQQAVMKQEGPAGLQRVLVEANERRKRYQVQWTYNNDKDKG